MSNVAIFFLHTKTPVQYCGIFCETARSFFEINLYLTAVFLYGQVHILLSLYVWLLGNFSDTQGKTRYKTFQRVFAWNNRTNDPSRNWFCFAQTIPIKYIFLLFFFFHSALLSFGTMDYFYLFLILIILFREYNLSGHIPFEFLKITIKIITRLNWNLLWYFI